MNFFTTYVVICTVLGFLVGGTGSRLYAVASAWNVAIGVCFYIAPLIDPDIYPKIRENHRFKEVQFHVGNFVLHALPALLSLYHPPTNASWKTAAISLFIISAWTRTTADASFLLNRTYAPMSDAAWLVLWTSMIAVSLVWSMRCRRLGRMRHQPQHRGYE